MKWEEVLDHIANHTTEDILSLSLPTPLWVAGSLAGPRPRVEVPSHRSMETDVKKRSKRYGEYLQSEEWKALRAAVVKRADGTCERCKINPGRDVHHKTYERLYKEKMSDLIFLCRRCHEFLEGHSNVDVARSVDAGLLGLYGHTYTEHPNRVPVRMLQYQFQVVRALPSGRWLVQLYSAWEGCPTDVVAYDESYLLGPDVVLFNTREIWISAYAEYSARLS